MLRGVQRQERRVDIEERLLLPLRQPGVGQHGQLDTAAGRTSDSVFRAQDPGADVELFRGDPECLGDLLQDLGGGLAQTTLDLAQVGVGDAGLLGELPQGEARCDALLLEVVTQ